MFPNQLRSYRTAAKINDVIDEPFVHTLDIPNSAIQAKFNRGIRVKKQFAQKIFFAFLKLLIDDCIQNNAKFVSPTRFWFAIYIKEINRNNRKRILKTKGIYENVDLIKSDFKIYEFVLRSSYLTGYNRNRRIRIGYNKYKELVEAVNEGKRYFE